MHLIDDPTTPAGVVGLDAGSAHDYDVDIAALKKLRYFTAERGVAEHDGAGDGLAVRAAQHIAVGDDRVAPKASTTRHLGNERSPERNGQRLSVRASTVPGDDDGAVVWLQVDNHGAIA
jgi:hypothetical protein